MRLGFVILVPALVACAHFATNAQVTFTATTSADVFVATGSSNNPAGTDLTGLNYGGAGTLVIAPGASVKGEFQSVIRFDLSGATNLFVQTYGTNWSISQVSLELTSNYGQAGVQPNNPIFPVVNGGKFVIEWLAGDDWLEGSGNPSVPTTDGLTFSMLPALVSLGHEALCTNTYVPPGVNVHVMWILPLQSNLVADVANGGSVSFWFYAANDQVTYLFNSYFYGRGNEPLIHVTAIPRLRILSGALTNGYFHIVGLGEPTISYEVQANSDLATTNWQTLGNAIADSAGILQFDDTTASTQSRRFYRLLK